MGRAYAALGADYREQARQCFRHAEGLKYLDIFMLRSGFYLEITSGYGLDEAERLCRLVIDNAQMSPRYRSEFWSKLGSCYYQRSFSSINLNRDRAFSLLRDSIKAYLEAIWMARSLGMTVSDPIEWMRKPIRQIVNWIGDDFEQLFLLLEQLSELKHDVDREAIEVFLELFLRSPAPNQKRQRDRLKALCSRTINRIGRNKRPLSANKGFETVVATLEALQSKLEELNGENLLRDRGERTDDSWSILSSVAADFVRQFNSALSRTETTGVDLSTDVRSITRRLRLF